MDKQLWVEHLSSWKMFLKERLSSTETKGDRIKIERQLLTIERTRCGAVLNPSLISEFISPSTVTPVKKTLHDYYLELNESQKEAVDKAVNSQNLCLIQGPPGTGKTQVITEICLQLFKLNPAIRILICSETHIAVNNVLCRIAENNNYIRIVRLRDKEKDDLIDDFSPETIIKKYLEWASVAFENKEAIDILIEELRDTTEKSLEKALSLSANIAGMTCNRAAAYNFRDSTEMFDVAIIDEVCKATLPEILSPLLISQKAILIGDPMQLPPVFCSEDHDVIKSIDNCKLNEYMYIDHLFNESNSAVILDTQYRMVDQIGDMISQLFYNGKLKNGRSKSIVNSMCWINYDLKQNWPPKTELYSDKPRIYNLDECNIISKLIPNLIKEYPDASIAVIAPYRAQVFELRKECRSYESVRIDTVDGFQGKECDFVIFSVTRTIGAQRFLSDCRRLNVALSRARDGIFIVGNLKYCQSNPLFKSIIEYCDIKTINLST